ncbi:uncharacterized protein LOC130108061 isoform X2 [Lampris incognitus]|uniref:uncharacterized protein LOC130108061 isoform X2 n=1 Tax=Lampris incognitus TaxID=2546036 RepID=UPI0024B61286|nr:uncharacterized protein LOC130108061 isoform X2 [Lampris incognitus]
MLTVHAMEWNRHKGDNLHKALSTRYVKTCQRAVEETARLLELREEVHCSEEMALQWVMDVQEWAGETTDAASDQRSLQQQSIEGLHLSLHHRKQSLYRQNDSNKLRHRLLKNLAKDKRRLFEQIAEYNRLVSEMQINVAVVERSLAGLTVSHIWPWEVHSSGSSVNISTKRRVHDQQMLTTRLQEERSILVLEMAQHCTSLRNLALALRTKIISEEGSEGLRCLLIRRLSEVEGSLRLVLQHYQAALGPHASLLGGLDDEEESEPSSSEESEEEAEEEAT